MQRNVGPTSISRNLGGISLGWHPWGPRDRFLVSWPSRVFFQGQARLFAHVALSLLRPCEFPLCVSVSGEATCWFSVLLPSRLTQATAAGRGRSAAALCVQVWAHSDTLSRQCKPLHAYTKTKESCFIDHSQAARHARLATCSNSVQRDAPSSPSVALYAHETRVTFKYGVFFSSQMGLCPPSGSRPVGGDVCSALVISCVHAVGLAACCSSRL